MTMEVARKAVEYACQLDPLNAGIIFFGGEPLLRKDLIQSIISYCHELQQTRGFQPHFKVTTNGMLLDEEFLKYSRTAKLSIALSVDGIRQVHDYHRRMSGGQGSFDIIDPKIALLLKYQPYASFYMVITPETVSQYCESVRYLFGKGVRYIVASLNYAGKWTSATLKELRSQYERLAVLYEEMTLYQRKFYFSPFEIKFASHIRNENENCEKCHLGVRQVSVSPDGSIYPCVQFVGKEEYKVGNVWEGIDSGKRDAWYRVSMQNSFCSECKIQSRCNNRCSCLNLQTMGKINIVSPFLCETEKILTPIVDRVGERLYRRRAPMFIQKHYNAVYPILSLIEDTL